MDRPEAPTIAIRDLVVSFGRQRVLDRLSLDVRPGEVLGLVGASGGGKSVLLRAILGLVARTDGEIRIFGTDVDVWQDRGAEGTGSRWGVMFQQGALFSSLSARQNIEFPMREYLDIPDRFRSEMAVTKLGMVGLSPQDAEKLPAELSGGMVKRVALARALALDPTLVFLDEPTSGLDPISASEFDALIRTLQRTLGLTVLMVTHDIDSLRATCDRVAALADGTIVALGPLAAMRDSTHPWVRRYFDGPRGRTGSSS